MTKARHQFSRTLDIHDIDVLDGPLAGRNYTVHRDFFGRYRIQSHFTRTNADGTKSLRSRKVDPNGLIGQMVIDILESTEVEMTR